MITKIKAIKNFGVYKNFSWASSLPEFSEKNVIYGWNYSGKTTLSRIFTSLKNKQLHSKFRDAEFSIRLIDGTELDQSNLSSFNVAVEVFNSEYIKENLKWESNESFDGITFDIGENVAIRTEIEKNNSKILLIEGDNSTRGRKDPYKIVIQKFNDYDAKLFSAEAKRIKNDIFNSLIEFDKSHFVKIKNSFTSPLLDYILNKENLQKTKEISLAVKNKEPIELLEFNSSLELINEKAKDILKSQPSVTKLIKALEENPKLYEWVKEGLPLHENKETCAFCSNDLSNDRISQLNGYFSNEASKVKDDIQNLYNLISEEFNLLSSYSFTRSKNDFFETEQSAYEELHQEIELLKKQHSDYLKYVSYNLQKKKSDNLFNVVDLKVDTTSVNNILGWIEKVNKLIEAHNYFLSNFDIIQSEGRKKLKEHLVASYLENENYFIKETEKKHAERCIKRYDKFIYELVHKIYLLEAQLKSITAGKTELQQFIQLVLNRKDISIEVTSEDKFILKRGSKIAENLSEGEKMAISFSYFLVNLESMHRRQKLKDTIIFIDDPISSLDANHIAQVYSLINSFFFRQNIDIDDPKKYVNCFKQLFISTHNFEFFSFIKDSNRINKKPKQYYFIKRITFDESELQTIPKALYNYKSEYLYLFDLIYKYFIGGCAEGDEKLILMPNAVRRFLEIYTLLKLPDSTDEVDARLKILMPEPHQLKTLHHFSHFTTFEKLTRHDELLMNLPDAVKELMDLLDKDTIHFDSLKRASSAS